MHPRTRCAPLSSKRGSLVLVKSQSNTIWASSKVSFPQSSLRINLLLFSCGARDRTQDLAHAKCSSTTELQPQSRVSSFFDAINFHSLSYTGIHEAFSALPIGCWAAGDRACLCSKRKIAWEISLREDGEFSSGDADCERPVRGTRLELRRNIWSPVNWDILSHGCRWN
jgi:hypothetical protein